MGISCELYSSRHRPGMKITKVWSSRPKTVCTKTVCTSMQVVVSDGSPLQPFLVVGNNSWHQRLLARQCVPRSTTTNYAVNSGKPCLLRSTESVPRPFLHGASLTRKNIRSPHVEPQRSTGSKDQRICPIRLGRYLSPPRWDRGGANQQARSGPVSRGVPRNHKLTALLPLKWRAYKQRRDPAAANIQ